MKPIRQLKIHWSNKEQDFMITYPRSCDGHLLHTRIFRPPMEHNFLPKEGEWSYKEPFDFIEELKKRGYDTKTLKFSVQLLPQTDPNQ